MAEDTLKAFHGFDELMTDMKIRGLRPLAEHEVTRIRKEVDKIKRQTNKPPVKVSPLPWVSYARTLCAVPSGAFLIR